jgi:hypothetical protein
MTTRRPCLRDFLLCSMNSGWCGEKVFVWFDLKEKRFFWFQEPVMMAGLSSQRPSCLSAQTASPTALFPRSPRVSWALPSRKTSANSENCSFSVSRRTLSRRKIGNDRILCAASVTSLVRTFSIPQVVSWHLSPAFV